MDALDEIVELVKDLEAALAIVRTNAKHLNLTLMSAKVEVELTASKKAEGGIKFDIGVSVDASTERKWSDVHTLILSLDVKQGAGRMGASETTALAEGILELASLHTRVVSLKSTDFETGKLELSLAFEKDTSGNLQVVAGGGKGAKSARRVSVVFRPSE